MNKTLDDFVTFVREQGVVGLAVGFILGGSVAKVVSSIVADLITPIISILFGAAGNLKDMYLQVGEAKIMWGNFLNTFIDFLIVAAVVYVGINKLGLRNLDKKKDK